MTPPTGSTRHPPPGHVHAPCRADDMCSFPANSTGWASPGVINEALITGARGNTTIWYRFGSDAGGWSDVRKFNTPPDAGDSREVRLLVVADHGHYAKDPSYQFFSYLTEESIRQTAGVVDVGNFYNGGVMPSGQAIWNLFQVGRPASAVAPAGAAQHRQLAFPGGWDPAGPAGLGEPWAQAY